MGLLTRGLQLKRDRNKQKRIEKAFEEEGKISEPSTPSTLAPTLEVVRTKLATHPTQRWVKRTLDKVSLIVVHHSSTSYKKSTFSAIAKYCVTPSQENHLSRDGAPGIPYHFGIDQTGVYQFNELTDVIWGAKGFNTKSVHICCLGDFSTKGVHDGKDEVPLEYLQSLRWLIDDLKKQFPKATVVTHRDLGKKACPGDTLHSFAHRWV